VKRNLGVWAIIVAGVLACAYFLNVAVADIQRGGKIGGGFALAATSVTGSDDVLGGADAQIVISDGMGGECNIEVVSAAGSQTLNGFEVQFRDTSWGAWYTVLADADFTTATTTLPRSMLPYVNGLAASETTHFVFRPGAAYAFRFRASVAANAASITVSGNCGSD